METRAAMIRRSLWMFALCVSGIAQLSAAQAVKAGNVAGGGDRVAGVIVSKTDGHPLARARLTLRDTNSPQQFESFITSDDGKFEFRQVPAGKYSLTGAKRGFITAAYDQHDQFSTAIVTGAGLDTENLLLKLAPDAVLSGKVMDEAGEPVRHAMVTLYYDNHTEGVDEIHVFRNSQTDDQGNYEMTPLMPGTYFLSATAKPWYAIHPRSDGGESESGQNSPPAVSVDRSLDVAYPVTYYADSTEADSATAIPVRGGEHLQVDIHLNPVPALRLIFHVPGDNQHGFTFPRLEQEAFDGSTFLETSGGRMISPGVMELTGVPAGRYDIRLFGTSGNVRMNGLDLTKDGEEIDTTSGAASSDVKVSVQIPGEPTLPPQLAIGLRSKNRLLSDWKRFDAKGEAELQQVAAGKYEVVVWGAQKPYSVAHMSAEGADVSGHMLTVKAGAAASLSISLTGGSVEVQGIVKRPGKGFAGAMVVLVPKNPEDHRDLFRRDQSDLDGTFVMRNVFPGSYTLLAIDNGWELDWSQPGVIAAYMKRGKSVEVGGQSSQVLKVDAIEVQSK